MSIEREEFEQAVADKWSDSYSFTRFGDEDYYDEVLEGMWWGWQASRQALEGEQLEVWLGSGDKLVADIYADDGGWAGVGIFNPPNGKTQGIGEKDDQIDGMSLDKNKALILIKSTRPESLQVVVEELQEAMAKMGYTHPASRQAVSVPKQWVDLMRELVKDLISEIKTKQKLKPDERVAEDLGAVREAIAMIAKQEQGHE